MNDEKNKMNDRETEKFYEIRNETTRICGAGDPIMTDELLTNSDPLAVARLMYIAICRTYSVEPSVFYAGERLIAEYKAAAAKEGWKETMKHPNYATTKINPIEAANKLLNLNLDTANDTSDLFPILHADSRTIESRITELLEGLDEEMVKKIAIKFSGKGIYNFYDYEDRLCDLMGEDKYDEWADSVGVL